MATLAATSSATLSAQNSLQGGLIRSRLEATRREADQAQAYADSLQAQIDEQVRVVAQVHQRVNVLERKVAASANPSTSQASTTAASPSFASNQAKSVASAPNVTPQDTTYIQALSEVFQFAKPILKSNLSTPQKDIVTESLFRATNASVSASQTNSKAVQAYGTTLAAQASGGTGKVLNTTA
jgi:hypothetical protein